MKVLTLLKAFSPFHTKSAFWQGNCLSGSVIVAKIGINLPQQVTRPKKIRISVVFEGGFIFKIDSTLSGSGKSPYELKICPM